MYWYKKYLFLGLLPGLLAIVSCKSGSTTSTPKFFDLKAYFKSEAARLAKSNPLVTKKAIHNRDSETLKVHIQNWDNELSLFADADINKPAWTSSYAVSETEGITTYRALDTSLKTQSIIIKKQGDKVKLILIYSHTKATIFGKVLNETHENLSYVPDSIYNIAKRQYTRTLGFNNYYVRGLFGQ